MRSQRCRQNFSKSTDLASTLFPATIVGNCDVGNNSGESTTCESLRAQSELAMGCRIADPPC
jgi:hypothetical protein